MLSILDAPKKGGHGELGTQVVTCASKLLAYAGDTTPNAQNNTIWLLRKILTDLKVNSFQLDWGDLENLRMMMNAMLKVLMQLSSKPSSNAAAYAGLEIAQRIALLMTQVLQRTSGQSHAPGTELNAERESWLALLSKLRSQILCSTKLNASAASSISLLMYKVGTVELLITAWPDKEAPFKAAKGVVKAIAGIAKSVATMSLDSNLLEDIVHVGSLAVDSVRRHYAHKIARPITNFTMASAILHEECGSVDFSTAWFHKLKVKVQNETREFMLAASGSMMLPSVRWELIAALIEMITTLIPVAPPEIAEFLWVGSKGTSFGGLSSLLEYGESAESEIDIASVRVSNWVESIVHTSIDNWLNQGLNIATVVVSDAVRECFRCTSTLFLKPSELPERYNTALTSEQLDEFKLEVIEPWFTATESMKTVVSGVASSLAWALRSINCIASLQKLPLNLGVLGRCLDLLQVDLVAVLETVELALDPRVVGELVEGFVQSADHAIVAAALGDMVCAPCRQASTAMKSWIFSLQALSSCLERFSNIEFSDVIVAVDACLRYFVENSVVSQLEQVTHSVILELKSNEGTILHGGQTAKQAALSIVQNLRERTVVLNAKTFQVGHLSQLMQADPIQQVGERLKSVQDQANLLISESTPLGDVVKGASQVAAHLEAVKSSVDSIMEVVDKMRSCLSQVKELTISPLTASCIAHEPLLDTLVAHGHGLHEAMEAASAVIGIKPPTLAFPDTVASEIAEHAQKALCSVVLELKKEASECLFKLASEIGIPPAFMEDSTRGWSMSADLLNESVSSLQKWRVREIAVLHSRRLSAMPATSSKLKDAIMSTLARRQAFETHPDVRKVLCSMDHTTITSFNHILDPVPPNEDKSLEESEKIDSMEKSLGAIETMLSAQAEARIEAAAEADAFAEQQAAIAAEVANKVAILESLHEMAANETDILKKQAVLVKCRKQQRELSQCAKNIEDISLKLNVVFDYLDGIKAQITDLDSKLDVVQSGILGLQTQVGQIHKGLLALRGPSAFELLDSHWKKKLTARRQNRTMYIPLEAYEVSSGSTQASPKSLNPLDFFCDTTAPWHSSGPQVVLISGASGSGKSTLVEQITCRLFNDHLESSDSGQLTVIPIVIPLPSLEKPTMFAVEETLQRFYQFDTRKIDGLLELVTCKEPTFRLLFVLDAYDELKSENQCNLIQSNDLLRWGPSDGSWPRILVTCRVDYVHLLNNALNPATAKPTDFMELRIQDFGLNLGRYINAHVKERFRGSFMKQFQIEEVDAEDAVWDEIDLTEQSVELLATADESVSQLYRTLKADHENIMGESANATDSEFIYLAARLISGLPFSKRNSATMDEIIPLYRGDAHDEWGVKDYLQHIDLMKRNGNLPEEFLGTPFMMKICVTVFPTLIEQHHSPSYILDQLSRRLDNHKTQWIWQELRRVGWRAGSKALLDVSVAHLNAMPGPCSKEETSLVQGVLDGLPITRCELYEAFVQHYFMTNYASKHGQGASIIEGTSSDGLQQDTVEYARQLATLMTQSGLTRVMHRPQGRLFPRSHPYDPFFDFGDSVRGALRRLVSKLTPLTMKNDEIYFIHKSIQEFFVANGLYDLLTHPFIQFLKDLGQEAFTPNTVDAIGQLWKETQSFATVGRRAGPSNDPAVLHLQSVFRRDPETFSYLIADFLADCQQHYSLKGAIFEDRSVCDFISEYMSQNVLFSRAVFFLIDLSLDETVSKNFAEHSSHLELRLLFVASKSGAHDVLELLFARSCINKEHIDKYSHLYRFDVNAQTTDGNSSLHLACKGGHVGAVNILRDHGADWDLLNWDKVPSVEFAIIGGHAAIFERFVKDGGMVDAYFNGMTSLHIAIRSADVSFVRTLIEMSSDPNAKESMGRQGGRPSPGTESNCLIFAANLPAVTAEQCETSVELVRMLVQAGADLGDQGHSYQGDGKVKSTVAQRCVDGATNRGNSLLLALFIEEYDASVDTNTVANVLDMHKYIVSEPTALARYQEFSNVDKMPQCVEMVVSRLGSLFRTAALEGNREELIRLCASGVALEDVSNLVAAAVDNVSPAIKDFISHLERRLCAAELRKQVCHAAGSGDTASLEKGIQQGRAISAVFPELIHEELEIAPGELHNSDKIARRDYASPLGWAVNSCKPASVRCLLGYSVSVIAQFQHESSSVTPLELARYKESSSPDPDLITIIELLHAHIDHLLKAALQDSNKQQVEAAILAGARLYVKDSQGHDAIALASASTAEIIELVGTALQSQLNDELIRSCRNQGKNIHEWLKLGASADTLDSKKYSALHVAAGAGNTNAVSSLLEFGSPKLVRWSPQSFHMKEKKNLHKSALFMARNAGHYGIVDMLSEYLKEKLHRAVRSSDLEGCKLALPIPLDAHGDELEIALREFDSCIALAESNFANELGVLKQAELDNILLNRLEDAAVIHLALDKQADPNCRGEMNCTPLHFACNINSLEVVEALLAAKADPNPLDMFDGTPLGVACMKADVELCIMLLQYKADPEASPQDPPLEAAKKSKNNEVVELIEKHIAMNKKDM